MENHGTAPERSIWLSLETYAGAAIVIALLLLGLWFGGAFDNFVR